MNFLNTSLNKILFIAGITILLLVSVYITFSSIQKHYGDSPISQVFTWIGTNIFYGTLYKVQALQITNEPFVAGVSINDSAQSSPQNTKEAYALPVLVYHSVDNKGYEEFNLDRASFKDQLFSLKKAGWNTVTLKDFQAFMRGEISLPERSFLLTFDDGTKNSYHPVSPLLKALEYTGLSFVLPKYSIDTKSHYYVSSQEIQSMLNSGLWEIGSHGLDIHEYKPIDTNGTYEPPLTHRLWLTETGQNETEEEYYKRITDDLSTSRDTLEKTFNVAVTSFAFPFGEFGRTDPSDLNSMTGSESIAAAIFESSFYQWWPGEGLSFNYKQDPMLYLYKRIEPKKEWSGEYLVQQLEAGLPKTLPYTSTLQENEGWLRNWGTASYSDNTLVLATQPQETGAAIFLDGSGHWGNYVVTATLYSPTHTGTSIIVRFKDYDNQVLCNYGKNFVHIEQTVSGKKEVIKGIRGENILPTDTYTAHVEVSGRTISCAINGTTLVSSEFIDPSLSSGGVGIKMWSQTPEEASLVVEKFIVENK